uniref:Uncharacterized protein n=1 Tax=Aegilops tauschii subsp. strangulata TaxID=200361 RepID=A0A453S3Y1_AEGTS
PVSSSLCSAMLCREADGGGWVDEQRGKVRCRRSVLPVDSLDASWWSERSWAKPLVLWRRTSPPARVCGRQSLLSASRSLPRPPIDNGSMLMPWGMVSRVECVLPWLNEAAVGCAHCLTTIDVGVSCRLAFKYHGKVCDFLYCNRLYKFTLIYKDHEIGLWHYFNYFMKSTDFLMNN